MTNSQRLSAVRQKLQDWFMDQRTDDRWEVRESILIRQGFYCGRRFDFAGFRAVWFVEEDQVKIYRRDGALVATFQPVEQTAGEPTVQPAAPPTLPAIHRPAADDRAPVGQQPPVAQPSQAGDPARRAA